MDPYKFIESFIQASCDEKNKRLEFDLKYSVSHTQRLIQEHLGISVMQDLALSSSATSSSFQLLQQTIAHLASSYHGGSEKSMPQPWKNLIRMHTSDPQVTKEPAKTSLGSKLKELQSDDVHEEPTQDLNVAAIINSDDYDNLSSTAPPVTNNSTNNTVAPPDSSVSPEISVQHVNPTMEGDNHTIVDIPMTPSATPPPPPHEDNKLGFTVFAVELVGALTNLAVSSKPNHNQLLIYLVVACSALALSISSTALVLHKKRPTIAKKMQKAAFLIGTFGFLAIMGMLLPSTITWCFTLSAFLVCILIFAVANLIK